MRRNLEDALRSIAALPLDDWNDPEWSTFEAAQDVIAAELGRIDRRRASRPRRAAEVSP